MNKRLAAALAAMLLVPSSWAQGPASGQQGPGMQRGGGPHMMGRGQGMGGWGPGPWHGGNMMYGCGPGMMGSELNSLDLTPEQRNKIDAIRRNVREKQFALMDQMDQSMQAVSFYRGGKFDEQRARNAYGAAEKIHRQMFENMLDAHKRVDALLTPQQRQQLSQYAK